MSERRWPEAVWIAFPRFAVDPYVVGLKPPESEAIDARQYVPASDHQALRDSIEADAALYRNAGAARNRDLYSDATRRHFRAFAKRLEALLDQSGEGDG